MSRKTTFYFYREITAKRSDKSTACGADVGGHEIKVGERIGWNPSTKKAMCATCWARWRREVEDEEAAAWRG